MPAPMTLKQRLGAAAQSVVQPYSFVSPIKGWNTRDALDAMDPADAIQIDNLYPDAGGVSTRNGYTLFCTGLGTGSVNTLAEYNANSVRKLFAACSGSIWDVSSGTAVLAPFEAGFSSGFSSGFGGGAGFGSDAWQTQQFLQNLFWCNGTDTPVVYTGSVFEPWAFTGLTGSPPIGVSLYQQRLFFWQNNSTGFWYADLNSISGPLAFFDLSAYTPRGGNLIAVTTYSLDGGNGVQDFIVFVMSSGDCLIYFGNDPSNLLNWALVGTYSLSPPVSPRAVCNYGAEAFLTTYDDHVPMKQQLNAISAGGLPARSKVSNAVQAAVAANKGAFGWQALYYPKGRRLIFNIPNPDGTFSQHVQNTGVQYADKQTGQMASPWCRFVNMNAFCWGLFEDNLYFGAAGGNIYLADTGSMDLLGPVTAIGQQSWNTLDSPLRKRATAIRPLLQTIGSLGFTFAIGFDYGDINITVALVTTNPGSPWDTSPWDTSPWSAEQVVNTLWNASGGSGVALSVALNISATQPATWLRTDLRGEMGVGF
jgi:hypothetical protein